ncbi:PBP1A family penicillin-binding protein [Candidatus Binatia bacterium]|nr:PBP1A family penicillin-binding protein [Candidatus Binatia bacterium]
MGKAGNKRVVRARRPFRTFFLGFAVILLAAAGSAAAILYREFTTSLPPVEKLLDYRPPVATRVFAADGTQIGEFFFEKRYLVPIYKIPQAVQLAFIAAEDQNFFEHTGIDYVSVLRAALTNYQAGSTRQGASTITQQVVKSLLLTPERSYERKIKEIVLSYRLERQLTKDEILYLYLNQIYLGNGAYGVQAAALEYFGRDVSELSLAQAAMLAGLPQAPSRYSPVKHFERAKARQRYVLDRMVHEGFVTHEEAEQAFEEKLEFQRGDSPMNSVAPYFVEHVRRLLEQRYGASAPYQLGLDVHTTLDLNLQRAADQALRDGVQAVDERQGFRGAPRKLGERELKALLKEPTAATDPPLPEPGTTLEVVVLPGKDGRVGRRDGGIDVRWAGGHAVFPAAGLTWATKEGYRPAAGEVLDAKVVQHADKRTLELAHSNGTQGALLSMEPATGDVKAMTGGLDWSRSQFNRATQAYRQPGSSFKPMIYAAAMDRGFTPASVINDAPISFNVGGGQVWTPRNFENRFFGPTTVRQALTKSRNVVTVKLVSSMGIKYLLSYLPRFGFTRPFPKNLSIALGSSEVTLLEMTEAFGVFANLGMRVEPRFITKITDVRGELIEEAPILRRPAISPDTAYVMTSMLKNVIDAGTGTKAQIDRPAAGKTGTTNDQRDVWFIGYTPQLLTGVWVGYDQDKSLGGKETGGKAAAPIWHDFMLKALDGQPVLDFAVPNEVTLVAVDQSGNRTTPGSAGAVFQAFKRGTEPGFPVAPGPADSGDEPAPEESVIGAAPAPAPATVAATGTPPTTDVAAASMPARRSPYTLPDGTIDGMARRRAQQAAAGTGSAPRVVGSGNVPSDIAGSRGRVY